MNVTINGKPETIREGQSVETYLDGVAMVVARDDHRVLHRLQ